VGLDGTTQVSEWLPLREPTFFILLSLAREERHGYAIMKDVDELSRGRVKLSTSTLYEALARLLDQGLIERLDVIGSGEESQEATQRHPGRPRKSYRLTEMGWRVLAAEADRLQALVLAAQRRLGGQTK
jgi:DNA-binding PadR family transcriptional regulator